MKEETKDTLKKMSVGRVTREKGKIFATGRSIQEECEEYEQFIAAEGKEAFESRVRAIVTRRDGDGESTEVSAELLRESETDTRDSDLPRPEAND